MSAGGGQARYSTSTAVHYGTICTYDSRYTIPYTFTTYTHLKEDVTRYLVAYQAVLRLLMKTLRDL